MGFIADRAWFWCTSCLLLNVTIYMLLPKRLGDIKFRLEFAQRLTSALHAMWMFFGAVDCWVRGDFTFTNGANALKGHLSIAEFCPSIDARLDHMLGYLIADQALDILIDLMKSNFSISGMLRANSFAVTLHHVLGIITHILCRQYDHGLFAFYTSGVYLAEGSTPFLHASWIMKSVGLGEKFLFGATGTLLVINFFVFRILVPPMLLFHYATNLESWAHYPAVHMKPLAGITLFVFMMLNLNWFRTLVELYYAGVREIMKKN